MLSAQHSSTAPVLAVALALALGATQLRAQKMPAPADSTRVVQMHDVHKLVHVAIPGQSARAERTARAERMRSLVAFAKTFVQPPLAAEEDISSLSGRYLVALARPEQQAWLQHVLDRNLQTGDHQFQLTFRQFRVPAQHFAALVPPLLEDRGLQPTKVGADTHRYYTLLDDTEVALLLRATEKLDGIEMLQAPRLLLHPMAQASLESGTKIPYVKDYAVQNDGENVSYHPVHDTLLHGLRIDASCGLVAEDLLGVSFTYEERKVTQPIPEFETTIGVNNKVKVQLPASTLQQLEQRLELPDGGTALLALTTPKGPQLMLLVQLALVK